MRNSRFRFAFVSNSIAIAELVRNYAGSREMPMEIRLANMEEAIPVAKKLLQDGVDVILGGGGTGKLLRRSLPHPIVTIERTHLDILNALIKAREVSSKIAFTCYGIVPPWPALFAKLLNVSLIPVPFTSTQELVAGISRVMEDGAGVIVGGGICVETAKAHGCEGILVMPGEEALERAMDETINIACSQQHDREQNAWLKGAFDALLEGIAAFDAQGRKIVSNKSAENILPQLGAASLVDSTILQKIGIERALREGQIETGVIRRIGGNELLINTQPVKVDNEIKGALAAFMPISRLRALNRLARQPSRSLWKAKYKLDDLVGNSAPMKELRATAAIYAASDAPVHIYGESGTGKEILAHGIHQASKRGNGPFVFVNCAALPETLLESELFGYEDGAFTGARRGGKTGLFELAHGGSIFLDEIGDISPALQVRLLRVLETGEIFRIGAESPTSVDVRVISSSWKDLVTETRSGRFRSDLYYRLTMLRLEIPPLRLRKEDIAILSEHILSKLETESITDKDMVILKCYSWPGNVRELIALLRRYSLLVKLYPCKENLLELLLKEIASIQGAIRNNDDACIDDARNSGLSLKNRLMQLEKKIIDSEIKRCENNMAVAAKNLGISLNTLWRKRRCFGK